jgi:pyruvate dehydrogenase E2 component (dihydrolipoamide acetyltransferase)
LKKEFRLPDVGEGLTEADIVSWHVKPGDTVTINQVIVDIETAKAVVELPSPYAGTVAALLAEEGQTVDVGTPIIAVDVPGAEDAGPEPARPARQEKQTPEARQPVLVGYGVKPGSTSRRPRKRPPTRPGSYPATPSAPPTGGPTAGGPPAGSQGFPAGIKLPPGIPAPPQSRSETKADQPPQPPDTHSAPQAPSRALPGEGDMGEGLPHARGGPRGGRPPGRVKAKPPVRRLARDLGVDLDVLTGSGPEGSVTKEDVERAASEARIRSVATEQVPGDQSHAAADLGHPQARGSSGSGEERIPVRGVRKHTAAAMVASAFTAPHVTEFLQVDATETMAAVRRARGLPEFAGVKVSPLLFVAKALLMAVRRHPMINSSWDEAAQEIVVKRPVNLGIAVAADRGLLVPNVKGADALPLAGLAEAIDGLAATARAGKTTPADLADGTITITNVGVFGVDAGTPILMPGEAAILAFGQVRDLPWVVSGELAVRKVTTLSLSFDHRIVDGELGSAVLRDVGSMLEDPIRMLAWS